MRISSTWHLAFAAAAAAFALALIGAREVAKQSDLLASARARNARFEEARRTNEKLRSEVLAPGELRRLEARHLEADALRARLAELAKQLQSANDPALDPNKIAAQDWTYSGLKTPRSAIVSVLWAASQGDVDRLSGMIGFPDDVRAKVDALYSQLPAASQQEYGSPEKVVATLLAGSFPKDALSASILTDKEWGEDAAISMAVEHGGSAQRVNLYRFRLSPDGWKLLVPDTVLSSLEKTLLADSQTQAPAPE